MGNETDYTKTPSISVKASPKGELAETSTSEATSAKITTFVTNVEKAATRGAGATAAEVYAAAVANPTTSASATEPATTTKATTLDTWKKPEAQMKTDERITKSTKMKTQKNEPRACPQTWSQNHGCASFRTALECRGGDTRPFSKKRAQPSQK